LAKKALFALRLAGGGNAGTSASVPTAGAGTTAGHPGADRSFRPADRRQHVQFGPGQFKIADNTLWISGDLRAVLSIVDKLREGRLELSRHGVLRAVAVFMSELFLPFARS
jgi:hypothetical protein